jgi:hypothetical protein
MKIFIICLIGLIPTAFAHAASVCDGKGTFVPLDGSNPIPVRDQAKDKNNGDCTAQAGECILDIWLKSNSCPHPWVNRGDIWNAEDPHPPVNDAGLHDNIEKAFQAAMKDRNTAAQGKKDHGGPAKPGGKSKNPPPFVLKSYADCPGAVEGQLGQDPPQGAYIVIPGSELQPGLKGDHAVVVTGCSTVNGVVQYQIHNSWGDNCGGLPNCDGHGNQTVPAGTINASCQGFGLTAPPK